MSKSTIRDLRKKHGLTQQELADKAGVSISSIQGWEHGLFEPKENSIRKIAEALGESYEATAGFGASARRIPVLGHIPAGIPIEAIEDILDYEDIPSSLDGEYFGLRVHGDSMYPKFLDGDTVIVRVQSDCNNGDDCVVLVNGFDATLKAVYRHEDSIELRPANTNYTPMFFKHDVKILGVVVELRRKI